MHNGQIPRKRNYLTCELTSALWVLNHWCKHELSNKFVRALRIVSKFAGCTGGATALRRVSISTSDNIRSDALFSTNK